MYEYKYIYIYIMCTLSGVEKELRTPFNKPLYQNLCTNIII